MISRSLDSLPLTKEASRVVVTRSVIASVAGEQLGRWRWVVRGELRALVRLLGPGEAVERMVGGCTSRWAGALMVATDTRLLLLSSAWWRPTRCVSIAYEEVDQLRVQTGRLGQKAVSVVSGAATLTLEPYDPGWVKPFVAVLGASTTVTPTAVPCAPVPQADGGVVSLGWRRPASMACGLWVNALLI